MKLENLIRNLRKKPKTGSNKKPPLLNAIAVFLFTLTLSTILLNVAGWENANVQKESCGLLFDARFFQLVE